MNFRRFAFAGSSGLTSVVWTYADGSHEWVGDGERLVTRTSSATWRAHEYIVQGDRSRQIPRSAAGRFNPTLFLHGVTICHYEQRQNLEESN